MFNISDMISRLADRQACGILIKKPSNIFYITGFSGEGYIYITRKGEIILYADGRYSERASKECFGHVKIVGIKEIYKDIAADILKRNAAAGVADAKGGHAVSDTLIFESDYIACDEYAFFEEEFKSKIKLVPARDSLSKIRSIKDERELNYILEAVSIAEKSMLGALAEFKRKSLHGKRPCADL
jgi:Xaa-Pro aminopeptidase